MDNHIDASAITNIAIGNDVEDSTTITTIESPSFAYGYSVQNFRHICKANPFGCCGCENVHDALLSPDGVIICSKHSFPGGDKDTRQCSIGKLNNKIVELEAKFLAVQDMLKTLMDLNSERFIKKS